MLRREPAKMNSTQDRSDTCSFACETAVLRTREALTHGRGIRPHRHRRRRRRLRRGRAPGDRRRPPVLLLEAGYSHHHPLLDMPPGIFKLIGSNSKYMTYHHTVPQEHLGRPGPRHPAGQRARRRHLGERAGLHARPPLRLRRVGRDPARQQRGRALGLGRPCSPTSGASRATTASSTTCTAPTARCWSPTPATSTTSRAGSSRACRPWASPSPPTSTARPSAASASTSS